MTSVGVRVYDKEIHLLEPGEYMRGPGGDWFACTPNGLIGCLAGHDISLHIDESITVAPSILVTNGQGGQRYHGYLRAGFWETLEDSTP